MSSIIQIIDELKPICKGGQKTVHVRRSDTCACDLHLNKQVPSSRINDETKKLEFGFLTATYLESTFPSVEDLFANDWELVS